MWTACIGFFHGIHNAICITYMAILKEWSLWSSLTTPNQRWYSTHSISFGQASARCPQKMPLTGIHVWERGRSGSCVFKEGDTHVLHFRLRISYNQMFMLNRDISMHIFYFRGLPSNDKETIQLNNTWSDTGDWSLYYKRDVSHQGLSRYKNAVLKEYELYS